MDRKDPYKILGVSRSAAQDEIKRAYRRLAKEHHPDRNPGDKGAEQRFKEVQAAYEVLGDPQRRAQYDRFGAGGPKPEFHTWSTGRGSPFAETDFDFSSLGDLTSIFEQFFSGGAGARTRRRRAASRPRRRGADIEHTVELSFEEAAGGTVREVMLTARGGREARPERIQFRVPGGVSDGQRIRVKGKGQDGPGGRGDLMILCRIRPHAYFRRDGLNVLLDLPLTIREAALGAKVDIPTLDGVTRVTVPAGTSGGTKLRLREKGIRDQRAEKVGDMLVVVRIQLPKSVSPKARGLLDELESELDLRPRADLGWPV
jgi:DnaJ-class molecular chaperone